MVSVAIIVVEVVKVSIQNEAYTVTLCGRYPSNSIMQC